MRFELTKNAVSYGFMSDFLIDTLILTKNLFIDRDIKDIKDPKNDSPNSIFKNFQYFDSKFHFFLIFDFVRMRLQVKILPQKKIITR